MKRIIALFLVALTASFTVAAQELPGAVTKKFIAFGWEFGFYNDPAFLLENADLFASTGIDGVVEIQLLAKFGCATYARRHFTCQSILHAPKVRLSYHTARVVEKKHLLSVDKRCFFFAKEQYNGV